MLLPLLLVLLAHAAGPGVGPAQDARAEEVRGPQRDPAPAAERAAGPAPDGRALLAAGKPAEAEAWFWKALEASPRRDAALALGVVDCLRAQGRLAELDARVLALRRDWLASDAPGWNTLHNALIAARALDRYRAAGDVGGLWAIFSSGELPADAMAALDVAHLPRERRRVDEYADCWDRFRDPGLRQAALDALLARPDAARDRAWSALADQDARPAEAVLASLHDERVRERLAAALEAHPDVPVALGMGWWYLLLAIEGSGPSYDLIERRARLDSCHGKTARAVLALLPRGHAPCGFTFELQAAVRQALEREGFVVPVIGGGGL